MAIFEIPDTLNSKTYENIEQLLMESLPEYLSSGLTQFTKFHDDFLLFSKSVLTPQEIAKALSPDRRFNTQTDLLIDDILSLNEAIRQKLASENLSIALRDKFEIFDEFAAAQEKLVLLKAAAPPSLAIAKKQLAVIFRNRMPYLNDADSEELAEATLLVYADQPDKIPSARELLLHSSHPPSLDQLKTDSQLRQAYNDDTIRTFSIVAEYVVAASPTGLAILADTESKISDNYPAHPDLKEAALRCTGLRLANLDQDPLLVTSALALPTDEPLSASPFPQKVLDQVADTLSQGISSDETPTNLTQEVQKQLEPYIDTAQAKETAQDMVNTTLTAATSRQEINPDKVSATLSYAFSPDSVTSTPTPTFSTPSVSDWATTAAVGVITGTGQFTSTPTTTLTQLVNLSLNSPDPIPQLVTQLKSLGASPETSAAVASSAINAAEHAAISSTGVEPTPQVAAALAATATLLPDPLTPPSQQLLRRVAYAASHHETLTPTDFAPFVGTPAEANQIATTFKSAVAAAASTTSLTQAIQVGSQTVTRTDQPSFTNLVHAIAPPPPLINPDNLNTVVSLSSKPAELSTYLQTQGAPAPTAQLVAQRVNHLASDRTLTQDSLQFARTLLSDPEILLPRPTPLVVPPPPSSPRFAPAIAAAPEIVSHLNLADHSHQLTAIGLSLIKSGVVSPDRAEPVAQFVATKLQSLDPSLPTDQKISLAAATINQAATSLFVAPPTPLTSAKSALYSTATLLGLTSSDLDKASKAVDTLLAQPGPPPSASAIESAFASVGFQAGTLTRLTNSVNQSLSLTSNTPSLLALNSALDQTPLTPSQKLQVASWANSQVQSHQPLSPTSLETYVQQQLPESAPVVIPAFKKELAASTTPLDSESALVLYAARAAVNQSSLPGAEKSRLLSDLSRSATSGTLTVIAAGDLLHQNQIPSTSFETNYSRLQLFTTPPTLPPLLTDSLTQIASDSRLTSAEKTAAVAKQLASSTITPPAQAFPLASELVSVLSQLPPSTSPQTQADTVASVITRHSISPTPSPEPTQLAAAKSALLSAAVLLDLSPTDITKATTVLESTWSQHGPTLTKSDLTQAFESAGFRAGTLTRLTNTTHSAATSFSPLPSPSTPLVLSALAATSAIAQSALSPSDKLSTQTWINTEISAGHPITTTSLTSHLSSLQSDPQPIVNLFKKESAATQPLTTLPSVSETALILSAARLAVMDSRPSDSTRSQTLSQLNQAATAGTLTLVAASDLLNRAGVSPSAFETHLTRLQSVTTPTSPLSRLVPTAPFVSSDAEATDIVNIFASSSNPTIARRQLSEKFALDKQLSPTEAAAAADQYITALVQAQKTDSTPSHLLGVVKQIPAYRTLPPPSPAQIVASSAASGTVSYLVQTGTLSPSQGHLVTSTFSDQVTSHTFSPQIYTTSLTQLGLPAASSQSVSTTLNQAFTYTTTQTPAPSLSRSDLIALTVPQVIVAANLNLSARATSEITHILQTQTDLATAQTQITQILFKNGFSATESTRLSQSLPALTFLKTTASPDLTQNFNLAINYFTGNQPLSPSTQQNLTILLSRPDLTPSQLKSELARLPDLSTQTVNNLVASHQLLHTPSLTLDSSTLKRLTKITQDAAVYTQPADRAGYIRDQLQKDATLSRLSLPVLSTVSFHLANSTSPTPLSSSEVLALITSSPTSAPLASHLFNSNRRPSPEVTLTAIFKNELKLPVEQARQLAQFSPQIKTLLNQPGLSTEQKIAITDDLLLSYITAQAIANPNQSSIWNIAAQQLASSRQSLIVNALALNPDSPLKSSTLVLLIDNYEQLNLSTKKLLHTQLKNLSPDTPITALSTQLLGTDLAQHFSTQPQLLQQAYITALFASRHEARLLSTTDPKSYFPKNFRSSLSLSLDHLELEARQKLLNSSLSNAARKSLESELEQISKLRHQLSQIPDLKLAQLGNLLRINTADILTNPSQFKALFSDSAGNPIGLFKLLNSPASQLQALTTFKQNFQTLRLALASGDYKAIAQNIFGKQFKSIEATFNLIKNFDRNTFFNTISQRGIANWNNSLVGKTSKYFFTKTALGRAIASSALVKGLKSAATQVATKVLAKLGITAAAGALTGGAGWVIGIALEVLSRVWNLTFGKLWKKIRPYVEEGIKGAVGGGIMAISSGAAGIGSAAGAVIGLIFAALAAITTAILTPLLIASIAVPVAIAFFLFILTNSSYILPPSYVNFGGQDTGGGIIYPGTASPDCPSSWPTTRGRIVQGPYGSYSHRILEAIDIIGLTQADLAIATHNGIVRANPNPLNLGGYGSYVDVFSTCDIGNGNLVEFFSRYTHLSTILVSSGQQIPRGTAVGNIGTTGTDNVHLHYEFRLGGVNSFGISNHPGRPPVMKQDFIPVSVPDYCYTVAGCGNISY